MDVESYNAIGSTPTTPFTATNESNQGFTINGDKRDDPKPVIGDDEDADNYFRGRAFYVAGMGRANHDCACDRD